MARTKDMIWTYFLYFALLALLLWIAGAWAGFRTKPKTAITLTTLGTAVFLTYIILMWQTLQRPPMRTMGETRLLYSLFLSVAGIIVYWRWRYRWILSLSTLLAAVFICINLLKPEIHSKTLMPALQSPWFAPHVIVYMFAYALMGAAFVIAVYYLFFNKKGIDERGLQMTDNLVNAGWVFLTIGILFGAFWAKEAWGHYWSWDPKETWAAATWLWYLGYVHLRLRHGHERLALWLLILGFLLLQMCWWGINYLPSAQGTSIHTYSMQ